MRRILLGPLAADSVKRALGSRTGAKTTCSGSHQALLSGCWEPVESHVHLIPDADCWIDGLDEAARRGDVFYVFDPESMATCLGTLLDG